MRPGRGEHGPDSLRSRRKPSGSIYSQRTICSHVSCAYVLCLARERTRWCRGEVERDKGWAAGSRWGDVSEGHLFPHVTCAHRRAKDSQHIQMSPLALSVTTHTSTCMRFARVLRKTRRCGVTACASCSRPRCGVAQGAFSAPPLSVLLDFFFSPPRTLHRLAL